MPSLRTEVTEIVTGLAMLGVGDVDWALAERPRRWPTSTTAHWERLASARRDPAHAADFSSAVGQRPRLPAGRPTGCRGRPPLQVEWKGPDKLPAVADVPADLRIDHVYLVSCKYLSKILRNSSPAGLFDGCLGERPADTVADWCALAAPGEYEDLWQAVRDDLPDTELPQRGRRPGPPAAGRAGGGPPREAGAPGRQGLPALRPRWPTGRPDRWWAALPDARPRTDAVAHAAPHRRAVLRARLVRRHSLRLRIDTRGTGASASSLKAFEGCGASRRASPSSAGRPR